MTMQQATTRAIRVFMARAGKTFAEVAIQIDYCPSMASQVINGRRTLFPWTLQKIAKTLRCTPTDIEREADAIRRRYS